MQQTVSGSFSTDTQIQELSERIIRLTQSGLPLVPRPYADIADTLGCSEQAVIDAFQSMLATGKIRRIGAVPNHYRLGYVANGMSVWDVDDDQIMTVGKQIGALDMVSHCYQRPRFEPDWPYNLFAMVHGKTRDEVRAKVDTIANLLGSSARSHDVLFSTRILKKTGMRLGGR